MASSQRFRPYVGPGGNQPPHQPDPPENETPEWKLGREYGQDGGLVTPGSTPDDLVGESPPGLNQDDVPPVDNKRIKAEPAEEDEREEDPDFEIRGKNAFRTSTDYLDANFRKPLEDSLRAFNNQHPADSKYNTETFRKRSNLYRPKFRTVSRKNEAALCAALFSNLDLIDTESANPSEIEEIVSAEVMKAVLQERLTVTMPWFQFSMGAMQDAQVQGVAICHSYWRYNAGDSQDGTYRVREDRPVQELIPVENFRFDPSAKWFDVVGTSPYLIELMPMYVGDIKERMRHPDPKGKKWIYLDEATIAACVDSADESTRAARSGLAQDAASQPRDVTDYDIVWVHRHIHRWRGEDFEWYMLASKHMLTEPEPLENNVWFGERPYVIGTCMLETHRPLPSSLATVTRPLSEESNDLDNQMSDNLKFILNKAWFVKRTANVDTTSLVRNVPGRITMVNDPEKDVKEVNWPDIPQSVFEAKNRNDADFDALAGNFSPMALAQAKSRTESFRTVSAVQSPAMMMTEYTLMTLVQTFLLPVLRQLVLLEQYYETDQTLLAIAGQKAKVAQRFGVNEITDAILEKKMAVNVNIGMGATDPATKLQRLAGALNEYANLSKAPPPGLDLKEIGKELFALAGYRDGIRFFTDADPDKVKLQQIIKLMQQKLAKYEVEKHNKHESNVVKLVTSREANMTKLLAAGKEDDHQSRHLLVGHLLEMEKIDRQHEQAQTMQAQGAAQGQAGQAQQQQGASALSEQNAKQQQKLAVRPSA